MAKKSVPVDEKISSNDFDLFDALNAIDKKDYGYYDRLTSEQQKKFVPYMMTKWMSSVSGRPDIQSYYIQSNEYYVNKQMFNEKVCNHPKLIWLMMCASSPGKGSQRHVWIPEISSKVTMYKENANLKDIKSYYQKIYSGAAKSDIDTVSEAYVTQHRKKYYLANKFPELSLSDIDTLYNLVTDEDIEQYERDQGNQA